MDNVLRYELIDFDCPNLDMVKELFESAFPPEERPLSIDDLRANPALCVGRETFIAFDGDLPVGFYVLTKLDDNRYLEFLATRSDIRGKGYGKAIMEHLMQEFKNAVLFCSIEKPSEDAKDDDIRRRRQRFYERCGMINAGLNRNFNGVDYLVMTNKTGDELERCNDKVMAEEKALLNYHNRSRKSETQETKESEIAEPRRAN